MNASATETPRTQSALLGYNAAELAHFNGEQIVTAKFSRTLERELTASREIAQKYEDRFFTSNADLTSARAEIDRLQRAAKGGKDE